MMLIIHRHSFLVLSSLILISASASAQGLQQSCQDNWRQTRRRLQKAKAKWANNVATPNTYNMTLEKQCNCFIDYLGPHDYQVLNGVIGVIHNQNTTIVATTMPTVEDLFDLVHQHCIQGCPSSGAFKCDVQFDNNLGYVKSLSIDDSMLKADDEFSYIVTNLAFA
jgi:hypothetical protein